MEHRVECSKKMAADVLAVEAQEVLLVDCLADLVGHNCHPMDATNCCRQDRQAAALPKSPCLVVWETDHSNHRRQQ